MLALHPPAASRPSAADPASPAELPIQSRIWHLYCQGHSQTAIAQQVGLERHAVARHLHAVETMLARERTDDLALARHRALDAAYTLFATTMDQLTIENQREAALWRDYESALAGLSPAHSTATQPAEENDSPAAPTLPDLPVTHYRAGGARLLAIALAALRHAIRLSGLEDTGATTLPLFPNLSNLPNLPTLPDLTDLTDLSPHPAFGAPSPADTPAKRPNLSPLPPQPSPAPPTAPSTASRSLPTASPLSPTAPPPSPVPPPRTLPSSAPSDSTSALPPSNSGTKWNILTPAEHPTRPPIRPPRAPATRRKHAGRR